MDFSKLSTAEVRMRANMVAEALAETGLFEVERGMRGGLITPMVKYHDNQPIIYAWLMSSWPLDHVMVTIRTDVIEEIAAKLASK